LTNFLDKIKDQTKTGIIEKMITFGNHGIRLNGTLYLPANASPENRVPAAILCHGYGNYQGAFETNAKELAEEGVATLTFDFRGHGFSEGVLDDSIVEDVIDAWNYLHDQPEVNRKRMGIIGHSMGAFSAILAAGKLKKAKVLIALACPGEINYAVAQPGHFMNPVLRHLVTLIFKINKYFSNLHVRVDWNKFVNFWAKTKPSKALAELEDCSKLFVFCLRDKASPVSNFMYSYAMASEPKQVIVATGTHNTPMESGTLRTQWMRWAVNAFHSKNNIR
jgi:alpha/beta superfamily hydrolase